MKTNNTDPINVNTNVELNEKQSSRVTAEISKDAVANSATVSAETEGRFKPVYQNDYRRNMSSNCFDVYDHESELKYLDKVGVQLFKVFKRSVEPHERYTPNREEFTSQLIDEIERWVGRRITLSEKIRKFHRERDADMIYFLSLPVRESKSRFKK
jgi:hypothetical protein